MFFEYPSFAIEVTQEGTTFSPGITVGYVMQVFISLLIILGLIYIIAKYLLPRLQISAKGKLIQVIDRIGLEPQVSAYIIKVQEKAWLVLVSNKQIAPLGQVEIKEWIH